MESQAQANVYFFVLWELLAIPQPKLVWRIARLVRLATMAPIPLVYVILSVLRANLLITLWANAYKCAPIIPLETIILELVWLLAPKSMIPTPIPLPISA